MKKSVLKEYILNDNNNNNNKKMIFQKWVGNNTDYGKKYVKFA